MERPVGSEPAARPGEAGCRRRVVVTGMGAVTPLGIGVDALWEGICAGRSGVGPITRFDASAFPCRIAAEVRDFDPERWLPRKDARRMDRFAQFAVVTALMAMEAARLRLDEVDRDRVGVVMGTGIGGMETLIEQSHVLATRGPDRVSPYFVPMMIANMASAQVSIVMGARGLNVTTVTACASSANAIGDAYRAIQRGEADVVFAGGTEAAVVPLAMAGFCAMKAMSVRNDEPERACRPFDAGRDGFVLGEGGGCLVLEELGLARARGAPILAEIVGYGMTSDAYHVVHPAPGGTGQAGAMRRALAEAGLRPEDVDYVNAHATSTPVGDREEVGAIKAVFGEHAYRMPVSSTKSMTGHLLGAAGVVELIICIQAMRTGIIPPTINYEEPDPECDLDVVPNRARPGEVRVALSNSFGFGGHNVSLIARKWEETRTTERAGTGRGLGVAPEPRT
jgi:3-oxoacyl-[acyl-carrier-protein] synthase II